MATLNDTRPVTLRFPVLEDLDSQQRTELTALLIKLVGNARASELTPDEQKLAALVYTGSEV